MRRAGRCGRRLRRRSPRGRPALRRLGGAGSRPRAKRSSTGRRSVPETRRSSACAAWVWRPAGPEAGIAARPRVRAGAHVARDAGRVAGRAGAARVAGRRRRAHGARRRGAACARAARRSVRRHERLPADAVRGVDGLGPRPEAVRSRLLVPRARRRRGRRRGRLRARADRRAGPRLGRVARGPPFLAATRPRKSAAPARISRLSRTREHRRRAQRGRREPDRRLRLYESLGMRAVQTRVIYEKPVGL